MSCEPFQSELSDGAAVRSPALEQHLAVCAVCRTRLTAEQDLFAAIDSGLHAVANAQVPPGLAASVRLRLAHQKGQRRWFLAALLPVSAAIALGMFAVQQFRRDAGHSLSRGNFAAAPTEGKPATAQPPREPQIANSNPVPNSDEPAHSVVSHPSALREPMPEILAPNDQETLLASYAERWRAHRHAPLVVAQASEKLSPMEVAPIQIDLLNVKSLTDSESR